MWGGVEWEMSKCGIVLVCLCGSACVLLCMGFIQKFVINWVRIFTVFHKCIQI